MTGTETGEDLLVVTSLDKRFRIDEKTSVNACQDISFTVGAGETFGIIGESGSGKTTLGRCVVGLIDVSSGSIRYEGTELTELSPRQLDRLRSKMQIVFQEPADSLNPQMRIGTQIAEPLRIHTRLSAAERRRRVRELLRFVGLPVSVEHARPAALPPGALQRVSIARAIATNPALVVLDEPTSVLAPEAEIEVIELLAKLQRELGLSYLFISHDLSLVRTVTDRVLVMYLGQVVESGPTAEIFASPAHPYSGALLQSVLEPDPDAARVDDDESFRLEGEIPSPINLPQGCYLASRCRFATDRCRAEVQTMHDLGGGRATRCWRVAEGDLSEAETALMRGEWRTSISSRTQ